MSKKYPIDQSPFYCLRSKKKLAELLGISSVSKLQKLSSDDFYKEVVNDGKKFTPPVGVLRYQPFQGADLALRLASSRAVET